MPIHASCIVAGIMAICGCYFQKLLKFNSIRLTGFNKRRYRKRKRAFDKINSMGYRTTKNRARRNVINVVATAMFIFGGGVAQAQTVAGSVTAVSGSVTIGRAGATSPATYGEKVDVGDRLTTGPNGNVTITLTDGSQMELEQSSTLTLDENTLTPGGQRQSTRVTLLTGLLHSLVRVTPGTPPNYEVHTPNAVASARGTSYDVDHETGVTDNKYPNCKEFSHVSVYQGTVEVSNPTNPSSPPVDVKPGQKVTVPCGGAPLFGAAGGIGTAGGIAAGVLGALGAGGIAVGVIGGTGGFGGGSSPTPTPHPVTFGQ